MSLLPYQISHARQLIAALRKNNVALDASDTGTGKTYSAAAICKVLKLRPFIICPKAVISSWREVCKKFNVHPLGVTNYELLRRGKYIDPKSGANITCPYLVLNKKIAHGFEWKPIRGMLIIFDEAHKCKNIKTKNSKILLSIATIAHTARVYILLLSATIADHQRQLQPLCFSLGLLEEVYNYKRWIGTHTIPRIHAMIFPERGARMRISTLPPGVFPQNQIICQKSFMDTRARIDAEYKQIGILVEKLRRKEIKAANILAQIIRARQRIELLKIPTLIDLTHDYRENGKSVVIFVNFAATLRKLAKELETDCVISGSQKQSVRENNKNAFQANRKRVMICNSEAGGTGISLHDTRGNYPRVSLISPSWSGQTMKQVLGRIYRANGKSPCQQNIIFCADTVEERIADILQSKFRNIDLLNNGVISDADMIPQTVLH